MLRRPAGGLARISAVGAVLPRRLRLAAGSLTVIVAFGWILGWYWSREPGADWFVPEAEARPEAVGYVTTDTLLRVLGWLLDKPGGYLSNDIVPPGVWLDNMPSFELGVLTQSRDLLAALSERYSRAESQSVSDPDLAAAQPALAFAHDSWIFPTTESRYREAAAALRRYRTRLTGQTDTAALFHTHAEDLDAWLAVAETRLEALAARLSASARDGRRASGDAARPEDLPERTPWFSIDDLFYEARGNAWALLHFLRAARIDFSGPLNAHGAADALDRAIHALDGGLMPVTSPMILNGRGFGLLPNHSLVLASRLSAARTEIAGLRALLVRP